MAEDDQPEDRTEEPSGRRLQQAREKGQVARSKELNATLILVIAAVGFLVFGQYFSSNLASMMRQSFEFDTQILITPQRTFERLFYLARLGLSSLIPILVIIFLVSLFAPILMGGWVFSTESLRPKFSKMNPIKGLARMVSAKSLVELLKSLLKFLLVAGVSIVVLKGQIPLLLSLDATSLEYAVSTGGYVIAKSFALISASLIVIAFIDVPFQLYEHNKSLKMTKQELKDEYKETEGKPEVKSALRRAQQAISRRRMMAEIPKANVVLTNPTHYAVAISYKKDNKKAPIVVAKGKGLIAFQIAKEAQSSNVPIICVPPLARAIYFSTKLNKEIPRGLYIAVAQVLAYLYQLRDKTRYETMPDILQSVPIPPELAKNAEEVE